MPINEASEGRERQNKREMQREKIMRPRVQEGWTAMMIGVTVTERKRRGRDSRGNPNSLRSSLARRTQTPLQHLSPYKLPIHPKHLLAPSSVSTTLPPSLAPAPPPHFLFLTAFLCSIHPLLFLFLHCLDSGRLELPPSLSPSQLWITRRPGTQRLPGPPDDSQPGHNKWLTALFT